MSDEIAENGTANGDVPEIELIIKVAFILHVLVLKIIWFQSLSGQINNTVLACSHSSSFH